MKKVLIWFCVFCFLGIPMAASAGTLTVHGGGDPNVIKQFMDAYPDITVYTEWDTALPEFEQAVLTEDGAIDIFIVDAPGKLKYMVVKQFVTPLDESEKLTAFSKLTYPGIRDALEKDGHLVAFALNSYAFSWTVDETLWKQYDMGEVPRTYAAFFQKLNEYDERYGTDPSAPPFYDCNGELSYLLQELTRQYILQYERPDAPLDFGTESYREALALFCDNWQLLEKYSYGNRSGDKSLLFSYSMGAAVTWLDSDKAVMLLPPALGDAAAQALCTTVSAAVIHPASRNKAEALLFIEFMAESLRKESYMAYTLYQDLDQPIRSAYYERNVKQAEDEIAVLEKKLSEAAEEDQRSIQEELDLKRAHLMAIHADDWKVHPESLQIYGQAAKTLRVPYDSLYLNTDVTTSGMNTLIPIIERFSGREPSSASMDALIREMNAAAKMLYAESN